MEPQADGIKRYRIAYEAVVEMQDEGLAQISRRIDAGRLGDDSFVFGF